MEKHKILPLMALGLLTFGTISTVMPAGASIDHHIRAEDDDDDDVDDATSPATVSASSTGSSGSGATPSGGAATGAGGMATTPADAGLNLMWLAAGGAGIALLGASGASAVARRRRAVNV